METGEFSEFNLARAMQALNAIVSPGVVADLSRPSVLGLVDAAGAISRQVAVLSKVTALSDAFKPLELASAFRLPTLPAFPKVDFGFKNLGAALRPSWLGQIQELNRSIGANLQNFERMCEDGERTFTSLGFAWNDEALTGSFVHGLTRHNARSRRTVLGRRMIAITRDSRFGTALVSVFESSSTLRKRLPAIREALDAHQSRAYYCSVALAKPITEVVYTDLLYLRREAIRHRGRPHARDHASGKCRKRQGRPEPLPGMHRKLTECVPGADTTLSQLVAALHVASSRWNPARHGNVARFGSASESARLLWNLYHLAYYLGRSCAAPGEPCPRPLFRVCWHRRQGDRRH